MICPNCGCKNAPEARFCSMCGHRLSPSASPVKKCLLGCVKALLYVLLFIGMQLIVAVGFQFLLIFTKQLEMLRTYGTVMPLTEEMAEELNAILFKNTHVMTILSALLTLLVLFLFFHLRHKNPLAEMHIRRIPLGTAALSLLFGAALQIAVVITIAFIPIPEDVVESFNEQAELMAGGSLLAEVINTVLLVPVIEEIVFRGLVFTRLDRGMRTGIAVVLSAAVFGAVHGHIISFCYAGLLGILFACIMRRNNDSVLPTILCHAGFNGTTYFVAMLGEFTLAVVALYFVSLAAVLGLGYLLLRKKEEPADPA